LEGANVIVSDLLNSRLKLAREFGAKWLCNPAAKQESADKVETLPNLVQRVTRGRGLDAAVIAVPSDDVSAKLKLCCAAAGKSFSSRIHAAANRPNWI